MKREVTIWCSSYLCFAQRVKIKIMNISSVSFTWWAVLKRNHESGTEAILIALNNSSGSRHMHLSLTWPMGFVNPFQVLRDLQGDLVCRSWLHYPNHEFLLRADFLVAFAIFSATVCNPSNHLALFCYHQDKQICPIKHWEEGLEDTCGGNAGQELSMCTHSPERQPYTASKVVWPAGENLRWGFSPATLPFWKPTVLCPALGSAVQRRHGPVRVGPKECHEDYQKAEAPLLVYGEGSGNTCLQLFSTQRELTRKMGTDILVGLWQ